MKTRSTIRDPQAEEALHVRAILKEQLEHAVVCEVRRPEQRLHPRTVVRAALQQQLGDGFASTLDCAREGGLVVEFVVDVCSNFIHQEAGHLQRERLTLGESSGELVSGVAPGPGTSDGEAAQQGDPIEVAGQAFPLGSCWILSSSSNKPCKPEVCMACTTRSLAEAEATSSPDLIPSSIDAVDIAAEGCDSSSSVGRDAADRKSLH
jgi:hypothetical protein